MKYFKAIFLCLILVGLSVGAWLGYKRFFTKPDEIPYKLQKPVKRSIARVIHAQGTLEAHGYAKVGPLITGTVKEILVKNDEKVTKGQLLAILDNGKGGDTDVRQSEALLESAQAIFDYRKANYHRQKALHESGQLSHDAYEKVLQDYLVAKSTVKSRKAALDRETFLYKNIHIRSPKDGFILCTNIKEGETVSETSPPSVMFEIAENLSIMNVNITIEENNIGNITKGQPVEITVDTYPNRMWQTPLHGIGNAPMKKKTNGQHVYYKGETTIHDSENILKPGMSVHAKITVAQSTNGLALPGYVFQINSDAIKTVAKLLGYSVREIDKAKRKELLKRTGKYLSQALWVLDGTTFIEKVVDTGTSDNAYFEVVSGLKPDENVVSDVKETDAMKKLYKKFVGGGL